MSKISELWFDSSADGCAVVFRVGVSGVTEIRSITHCVSNGGFCRYFAVYIGDRRYAEVYSPKEVYYEDA